MIFSFQWALTSASLLLLSFFLNGCSSSDPIVTLTAHNPAGEEVDSKSVYIEKEVNVMSITFKRFLSKAFDDDELVPGVELTVSSSDFGEAEFKRTYRINRANGKMSLFQVEASGLTPVLIGFQAKGRKTFKKEFTGAIADVLAHELHAYHRKMKKAQKAA